MKFEAHAVRPIFQQSVRDLCTAPYPNHPKGCPNFGKRDTCPPRCKLLSEVLNLNEDVWALWATFDIGSHIEKMRRLHPSWSKRQLVCCLYWQGTVRKFLRVESERWLAEYMADTPQEKGKFIILTCPEATGVNVTQTMADIGIDLEWPPEHVTRMIYLAGYSS